MSGPVVRLGRQTLILMPEIALTSAFLERFASRFGVRPAAWHSAVSGRRRERILAGVESGGVPVVAGDSGGAPETVWEGESGHVVPGRDVEAIADASPACVRGIPDTAPLVIGAFRNPKPSPKARYDAPT